jgi:hypothetical protein
MGLVEFGSSKKSGDEFRFDSNHILIVALLDKKRQNTCFFGLLFGMETATFELVNN